MKTKPNFILSYLVDLPLTPNQAESDIYQLDKISHHIIDVDKKVRRRHGVKEPTKYFNFYKSESIICFDISSVKPSNVHNLEILTEVINLYPFICINNKLSSNKLESTRLCKELYDNNYILPVFPVLNPVDYIDTALRFGDNLLHLIKGNKDYLDISEFSPSMINDITNRFTGASCENNKVNYYIDIVWLGVNDKNISIFLNDLFNHSIQYFNAKDVCESYEINYPVLLAYLKKSMLFEEIREDIFTFRLCRGGILLEIKSRLLNEFEKQLLKTNAIDTTYTKIAEFEGNFTEYHELGKLFDVSDTFSIKLINNIKDSLKELQFDAIFVVDNGYQDDLFQLICETFDNSDYPLNVSRVINNDGKPQLYPFDKYPKFRKAIIFIDLCNTGSFLNKVINFLSQTISAEIIGVYSFLIDVNFNINNFLDKIPDLPPDFKFNYFIEKRLHNVSNISDIKQKERRQKASNNRYLFFWDTVNKIGDIKIGYNKVLASTGEIFESDPEYHSIFMQKFTFNEKALDNLQSHSELSYFVYDILHKHKITGCLIKTSDSGSIFSDILKSIMPNVESLLFGHDKYTNNIKEFYNKHKSVLIYDDTINSGISLLKLLKYISIDQIKAKNNVSILTLFSRKNVQKQNTVVSDKYLKYLSEIVDNNIYVYFESDLPYYFLNSGTHRIEKRFSETLQQLFT